MACQYLSFLSNLAQQVWMNLISDRIPVYSEIIRQAKKHGRKAMTDTGFPSQSISTHRLSLAHSGSHPIFPARIQNHGVQNDSSIEHKSFHQKFVDNETDSSCFKKMQLRDKPPTIA